MELAVFVSTDQKMFQVAKNLHDWSFFIRMNAVLNAADAVVKDVLSPELPADSSINYS